MDFSFLHQYGIQKQTHNCSLSLLTELTKVSQMSVHLRTVSGPEKSQENIHYQTEVVHCWHKIYVIISVKRKSLPNADNFLSIGPATCVTCDMNRSNPKTLRRTLLREAFFSLRLSSFPFLNSTESSPSKRVFSSALPLLYECEDLFTLWNPEPYAWALRLTWKKDSNNMKTDTQTHMKVKTEDTLSGFQEFSLQPIIKDRSNTNAYHIPLAIELGIM